MVSPRQHTRQAGASTPGREVVHIVSLQFEDWIQMFSATRDLVFFFFFYIFDYHVCFFPDWHFILKRS